MKKKYFNEQQMFDIWSRGIIVDKIWSCKHLPKTEQKLFYNQILALIKAIIFTHRFQRFTSVEECESIAIEAIVQALGRYDPNKILPSGKQPSLFNYLSLTAKRSIQFSTINEYKNRMTRSYEESVENGYDNHYYDNIPVQYDCLLYIMKDKINHTGFISSIKKELHILFEQYIEYLKIKDPDPSKRKMIIFIREKYPEIKASRYRQLYEIMYKNKEVFIEMFTD